MNIEQKLSLYPHIGEEIKNLNNQLISILDNKYNVSITSKISGMPGASGISDNTYKQVEKIFDVYDKDISQIEVEIEDLVRTHRDISKVLLKMNSHEKEIIELVFFKKRKWADIPYKMNYSRRQCYRIYSAALEKIYDEFKI